MKKRILSLLLVLLMVVSLVPTAAMAEDDVVAYEVTGGNIYFEKATGTVTSCDPEVTEANIPSEIDGVKVTSIGYKAFAGCMGLMRVTIPDSVTSIGNYAFRGCTSLMNITIPADVEYAGANYFRGCTSLMSINVDESSKTLSSIDGVLFNKDRTKLLKYPEGKTCAYYEIPNSVKSIIEWAFYGSTNLTNVTIPNSVTNIENYVFYQCTGLTSIIIPSSLGEMNREIFSGCTSLASVTIQNGVTSIGDGTFRGCTSLTNVEIPNSVMNIEPYAFDGCTNLTGITIPDSVTRIDDAAFRDCKSLKSIEIPSSVTSIGESAFFNCTSLTNATIKDGVTSIGNGAFSSCTSLISIEIPSSVTSIGESAFSQCARLTSINVSNANTVYSSVDGVIFNKDKTEVVLCPEGKTDASYMIPNSVTSIGNAAFSCCKNLTNVIMPSSVTSIGESAFWMTALTDIYYSGTKEQWNKIRIGEYNYWLPSVRIHYSSFGPVDPIDPVDPIEPVDPVTPSGFVDVPSDAFYANAVKWAVENEITTGVGNNRFDPNGQCTRGQVVTFLWRAAGKPTVSANVSFSDVQPGTFYYEAVKWAVANGITTGVGGNRFAPNDTCTRGQVVTFLHRAENSPAASTISSLTDVPATAFYYNAVNWAVANGITNGTGNGRFSPNDTCTRAQVVTFLYRAQ